MSKILKICTDGDTSVHHPVSGIKLNDYGTEKYIFKLTERNKSKFIEYMLDNSFKFSKKFNDVLLAVMDDVVNILTDMDGKLEFSNYSIEVKEYIPVIDILED